LKLVEILKPVLLTHLVREYLSEWPDQGQILPMLSYMTQIQQQVPTYLRAVKSDEGKYIAYIFAFRSGNAVVINHAVSRIPKVFALLFEDLQKWCKARGVYTLVGSAKYGNEKLLKHYQQAYGFEPYAIVLHKKLGGEPNVRRVQPNEAPNPAPVIRQAGTSRGSGRRTGAVVESNQETRGNGGQPTTGAGEISSDVRGTDSRISEGRPTDAVAGKLSEPMAGDVR
jgi:hypothetical protein